MIIGLLNEEIFGATLDKGTRAIVNSNATDTKTITLQAANSKIRLGQLVSGAGVEIDTMVTSITGTSLKVNKTQSLISGGTELVFTNPSFVNRKVEVYKVFINTDTGEIIGDGILTFKGFITSTNIQEAPKSTRVQWNMTSHWGDFSQISGRMTSDEIHRALDSNGRPQKLLTVKPQYATDLGFLHGDMSLNTIATYQTQETRFRTKTKRRGGLAGLFGLKKTSIEEIKDVVLRQLIDNWSDTYQSFLADFSADDNLKIPELSPTVTSSPENFLKFWENRFNKAGEDSIRKISRLYALI